MIKSKKTNGVLSNLIKNIDEKELEKASNRMLVAAKICSGLKKMGLTQKEFASKMNKSESEISAWLSGDRNFTIDTLTEISLSLNISLLDTSVNNAVTIPINCVMSSNGNKRHSEIIGVSSWNYPLDSVSRCLRKQEIV